MIDFKTITKLNWNGIEISKLVRCSDGAVLWESNKEVVPVFSTKFVNTGSSRDFKLYYKAEKKVKGKLVDQNENETLTDLRPMKNGGVQTLTIPTGEYMLYFDRNITAINMQYTTLNDDIACGMITEVHILSSDFNDDNFQYGTSNSSSSYLKKQALYNLSCYDDVKGGITYICNYKFKYCNRLANQTSLVDWNNVKYIGSEAFSNGTIPFQVMSACTYCGGYMYLRRLDLPSDLRLDIYFPVCEYFGTSNFRYNSQISSITLPKCCKYIGMECFSGSDSYCVKNLDLGDSLEQILPWGFSRSDLSYVRFPNTLTYLGDGVFELCARISNVVYDFRSFDGKSVDDIPRLSNSGGYNQVDWRHVFGYDITKMTIVVPDSLYDAWILKPIWSSYAQAIIKASEYVE